MQDIEWNIIKSDKKKGKRASNNKTSESNTYLISSSSGLDCTQLRKILNGCGWREINAKSSLNYVKFIYVDGGKIDKGLYHIKCVLKSLINEKKEIITNKANLYFAMQKYFPDATEKYLAKTRLLKDVTEINDNEILIVKPVGRGACSGKDILRITQNVQLSLCQREYSGHSFDKYLSVIAVDYIRNPLIINDAIFNGKKFHIRTYMLVTTEPFNVILFNKSKILTAKEKYIDGDYDNANIHDTHLSSTEKNLYFPNDLHIDDSDKEKIILQINDVANYLKELLRNNTQPYPEAKFGFEVFGLDFLITSEFKVILMEVNDRIGIRSACEMDNTYSDFSRDFFSWIYENAIKTILGKNEK